MVSIRAAIFNRKRSPVRRETPSIEPQDEAKHGYEPNPRKGGIVILIDEGRCDDFYASKLCKYPPIGCKA